jgi:hypothetical protein
VKPPEYMKRLSGLFPIGAIFTIGGVCLSALLEWHSFDNTQDWEFAFLSQSFGPVLLLGTILAIVGSFVDRRLLSVSRARVRGIICWVVSGVSFLLLVAFGNIHRWTIMFVFPAFVGLVTGAVLLYKSNAVKSDA